MAAKINRGLRLKIIRLKAGLLQYQLAAHLGIHASRLSEIESGRRTPPPDLLCELEKILDTAKVEGRK